MRWSRIIILTIVLSCIQAFNHTLEAQKLTLDLENVSVLELFRIIEKETGLAFFYSNNEVDVTRTVTVKVKDTQLVEILGIVFPEMRCLILEERIVLIPERRQTHAEIAGSDPPGTSPSTDTVQLSKPRPIYNILKEAIVVGYGIQQKKNVTGAVSVLD